MDCFELSANRREICRKFVDVVAGNGKWDDSLDILYDIGMNDYSGDDWTILENKLRNLICSE